MQEIEIYTDTTGAVQVAATFATAAHVHGTSSRSGAGDGRESAIALSAWPFFFFFFFFFFCESRQTNARARRETKKQQGSPLIFFFFFSSSSACYTPCFSSTGTQPDKSCFTFSAIHVSEVWNAHCAANIACWPLDRRIPAHELYFACAATSHVPPLSIETGFIIRPTGVNCTLSLRAVPFSASLSTLIPWETSARRLAGAKKKHQVALYLPS